MFGGTFVAIVMLTLPLARALAGRGAGPVVAVFSAVYGVGQVVGPIAVTLVGGDDARPALALGGALVVAAALVALPPALGSRAGPQQPCRIPDAVSSRVCTTLLQEPPRPAHNSAGRAHDLPEHIARCPAYSRPRAVVVHSASIVHVGARERGRATDRSAPLDDDLHRQAAERPAPGRRVSAGRADILRSRMPRAPMCARDTQVLPTTAGLPAARAGPVPYVVRL